MVITAVVVVLILGVENPSSEDADCDDDPYFTLDPVVEIVMVDVVVSLDVTEEVVTITVVPLITVTVVIVELEVVLALGRTGDWIAD